MSVFKTLLSVAVAHNYNLSGVCPSLNFYPTEKTRAVIENAGLAIRKTLDGIQLIYDQSRLEALEMYALDAHEPLSFDFKIASNDPDFRNYTEPFTGSRGELLYFDNRASSGSGKQVVSTSEFVSDMDLRLPVENELNDILSHRDRLLPPEFVLRIYANDNEGSLLQRWLDQPPTVYSIRFNSKQRYWKYYLLGKIARNNQSQGGFYIVDPDNNVEFETTGQEMLANQSVAYTFRSKHQLPLYEQYPFRFQLRQKGAAGESTIISNLPAASVKQFGVDAIADHEIIVSEIYINS